MAVIYNYLKQCYICIITLYGNLIQEIIQYSTITITISFINENNYNNYNIPETLPNDIENNINYLHRSISASNFDNGNSSNDLINNHDYNNINYNNNNNYISNNNINNNNFNNYNINTDHCVVNLK
ncbi:hypothetical protein ACTA71_012205 [Dictyostelium dimigraforme]